MIALLGALQNELSGVAKSMTVRRRIDRRPLRIVLGKFAGKDVLLAQTGMGKDCALQAAGHILESYPVSAIISFGFGGALAAERQIGELVLCQKLFCENSAAGGPVYSSDERLAALAVQAMKDRALSLFTGSLLTVDRLAASAREKQTLGEAVGAQVVDMETYWIAGLAAARNVPFLAVRAISDTLDEILPPFDRFINSNSAWLWKDALRYFLVTPRDLLKLPGIYRHSQRACDSLTAFLSTLVLAIDGDTVGSGEILLAA